MNMIKILTITALVIVMTGCAASRSTNVYTRDQARQVQTVEWGVIQSVEPVAIQEDDNAVGSLGGAIIGGIAGSAIGQGRGSAIAATLGAIAGGVAGNAIEQGVTTKDALKIFVTLDNGSTIAVVQEADVPFQVGERVKVLSTARETRVSH